MDFTDVGEGFEPIDKGWYEATVFEIEPTTFSSGNEGWKLIWKIQSEGKAKGRQVFDNLVNTPKALWHVKAVAVATGAYSAEELGGAVEFDANRLQGAPALIQITHEEYNGSTYDRIGAYKPIGDPSVTIGAAAGSSVGRF